MRAALNRAAGKTSTALGDAPGTEPLALAPPPPPPPLICLLEGSGDARAESKKVLDFYKGNRGRGGTPTPTPRGAGLRAAEAPWVWPSMVFVVTSWVEDCILRAGLMPTEEYEFEPAA